MTMSAEPTHPALARIHYADTLAGIAVLYCGGALDDHEWLEEIRLRWAIGEDDWARIVDDARLIAEAMQRSGVGWRHGDSLTHMQYAAVLAAIAIVQYDGLVCEQWTDVVRQAWDVPEREWTPIVRHAETIADAITHRYPTHVVS
jgi:hypothetical protein